MDNKKIFFFLLFFPCFPLVEFFFFFEVSFFDFHISTRPGKNVFFLFLLKLTLLLDS